MQIVAKPKRGQEALSDLVQKHCLKLHVACSVPQYRDEIPQIGKLLETNEEVKIEWWIRTYTGTWRALTKRNGRSTEPWTETLPKSCMLYQVSLTEYYSKIPKAEQEKLRKTYLPLLDDSDDYVPVMLLFSDGAYIIPVS